VNEEQTRKYDAGMMRRLMVAASMHGALSVWMNSPRVPPGIQCQMKLLVEEYEAGSALIRESLEPWTGEQP
jgi:hypothetical protein